MKNSIKTKVFFALVSIFTLSNLVAQLPEKAEDVHPLFIGDTIPTVNLMTMDSTLESSSEIIKGKSLLVVYRGGWCPYCNMHLSAIGEIKDTLNALGYNLVAISTDRPEVLNMTQEKGGLDYALYSDYSGAFSKEVGIAYKAPEKYGELLSKTTLSNGDYWLPVPSIFVVDENGVILFEYVVPNYKVRMSPNLLLAILTNL